MYTHMSAESTIDAINSTIETENKNFLEIPINIKYKFNLPVVSSFLTPYIATGPAFAFKFGGDNDVFKTKTFQCAWNVGVGIEFFSHLQITGQYAFGKQYCRVNNRWYGYRQHQVEE
jgi:Outer membrane protein beta-barrel domain